jgi:hypothetical protein
MNCAHVFPLARRRRAIRRARDGARLIANAVLSGREADRGERPLLAVSVANERPLPASGGVAPDLAFEN